MKFGDLYLMHHGILGMKWGVRRYQNPDGTLTEEGKRRHKAQLEEGEKRTRERDASRLEELKRVGIDNPSLLKKGTRIKRFSSVLNEDQQGRVYGSMTKDDAYQYKYLADYKGWKHNYESDYEATKDLKVASVERIIDETIKLHGDRKIKDLVDEKDKQKTWVRDYLLAHGDDVLKDVIKDSSSVDEMLATVNAPWNRGLSKKDRTRMLNATRAAYVGIGLLEKAFDDDLADRFGDNKLLKTFKKQGYDAIVDIMDYYGYADYPVIIIDNKNLKKIKTEQHW